MCDVRSRKVLLMLSIVPRLFILDKFAFQDSVSLEVDLFVNKNDQTALITVSSRITIMHQGRVYVYLDVKQSNLVCRRFKK